MNATTNLGRTLRICLDCLRLLPLVAWGRCRACYDAARRAKALPRRVDKPPTPTTCGCGPHYAKGLCRRCHNRVSARNSRARKRASVAT